MKKHFLALYLIFSAVFVNAQDFKLEDKDSDIFILKFTEYTPAGFAFFKESTESVEKNKLKARVQAWNAAMDYAEKQGCLYVGRPFDNSTERERRLLWQATEEMDATGQKANAEYAKSYMIKLSTGRVFRLKQSVEESLNRENDFICIREQPTHKVVLTAIGAPSELRR